MTMITSLHNITGATCNALNNTDCLTIATRSTDAHFSMHLPPGTGQAIADAINAAVARKEVAQADEVAA